MDTSAVPAWLSAMALAAPVRQVLGSERCTVTEWTGHRLVGGGEGLGVWRLAGYARTREASQPWSMILKGWAAPDP